MELFIYVLHSYKSYKSNLLTQKEKCNLNWSGGSRIKKKTVDLTVHWKLYLLIKTNNTPSVQR